MLRAIALALNIFVGWCCFAGGSLSGILSGLFFHSNEWMGGYGSWRRRMTRLGHISFFGLGLLNLCYGLTVAVANVEPASIDAILLIIGAVTMPLVCYLAAYRKAFRHLFAIPALSVTIAVLDIARRLSI